MVFLRLIFLRSAGWSMFAGSQLCLSGCLVNSCSPMTVILHSVAVTSVINTWLLGPQDPNVSPSFSLFGLRYYFFNRRTSRGETH